MFLRSIHQAFPVSQLPCKKLRPALLALFPQKGQFAKMMSVTQPMKFPVAGVTAPPVMHSHSGELSQHPHGIDGLRAPSGMHAIVGRRCRAGAVKPRQLSLYPQPGLVEVHHRRGDELRGDLADELVEIGCGAGGRGGDGAGGHGGAEQFGQGDRGAFLG